MLVRHPAVAGQFYPGDPKALRGQIQSFACNPRKKSKVIGIMSPHAGYIYSGKVAAELMSRIEIPPTAVILGPNHRGDGEEFAIMTAGEWATPLGNAKIDTPLAQAILGKCRYLREDAEAHRR
ncbi:MAG TPA: AmmeMemoRadiSam system protein B, partial [bacterium]|nr:AmmeMemoRadiSam system protein B [bacterium]